MFGGLAQLARAPALQAGGQRFESVILHLSKWTVKNEKWKNNSSLFSLHSSLNKIFDILTQARL